MPSTAGADLEFGYLAAQRRLAAIEKIGAPEAAYAYDAFGLRVYKDLTIGGTTHANYDPDGRLLAEGAATGVADREYVWLPLDFAGGGDQAWALPIVVVTEAGTAGPRIHYTHTDQLGTPAAMTSGGLGQLEWSAVLRPFGEVQSITGTESLALRLPGQLFDPETGFHQNWHRDYDPKLGRYLQSDPIGLEGGLSTYGYANQNPTAYLDPDGRFPWLPLLCAAAAAAYDAYHQYADRSECQEASEFDWFEVGVSAATGGVACFAAGSAWRWLSYTRPFARLMRNALRDETGGSRKVGRPTSKRDKFAEEPETKGHDKKRPSTRQKHEEGDARRQQDKGREKGDIRRPY